MHGPGFTTASGLTGIRGWDTNYPSRFSSSPIAHIALSRFVAALEGMVHATQELADSLDETNVAAGTAVRV